MTRDEARDDWSLELMQRLADLQAVSQMQLVALHAISQALERLNASVESLTEVLVRELGEVTMLAIKARGDILLQGREES